MHTEIFKIIANCALLISHYHYLALMLVKGRFQGPFHPRPFWRARDTVPVSYYSLAFLDLGVDRSGTTLPIPIRRVIFSFF